MEHLLLFLEFFKIGLFSFGGGYGMLPLMEETVVGRDWITSEQFFDFVGVSCVRLFATPWTAACQASVSITNFQSLVKLNGHEFD